MAVLGQLCVREMSALEGGAASAEAVNEIPHEATRHTASSKDRKLLIMSSPICDPLVGFCLGAGVLEMRLREPVTDDIMAECLLYSFVTLCCDTLMLYIFD